MTISMDVFLKENNKSVKQVGYIGSKNIVDADNKPVIWTITLLSTKEFQRLARRGEATPVIDKHGSVTGMKNNTEAGIKVMEELIQRCVTYPNLSDAKLQDSWGVVGEIELAQAMLNAGEFTDLSHAVVQAHGIDCGDPVELIEQAKN